MEKKIELREGKKISQSEEKNLEDIVNKETYHN